MLRNDSRSSKSSIRECILWIFGLGEVIMYNCGQPSIQYTFAFTSYAVILIAYLYNRIKGIKYFICFNILALGIFNFWGKLDVVSYWGLRVGGFSFNILFTIFLTILTVAKKHGRDLFPRDKYTKFFFFFYCLTLACGIFSTLFGYNYSDNLFSDILTFSPIIFYSIMIKDLGRQELLWIIIKIFSITIYALLLAYILDKRFVYTQDWFVVGNTMSFLSPIGVIILWKYYSKPHAIFYILTMFFLIVVNAYFSSGKTFIIFGILLLWPSLLNKHTKYIGVICILLAFPTIINGLDIIANQFDSKTIAFKITQITQAFKIAKLSDLASEFSSMGNITAEALTLLKFYVENPIYLLFGQGMGAGVPDYYGYLTPFAGTSGYAEIDAIRNNFFNLHIAPYKVFANGGLVMLIWYCGILYELFKIKNSIALLAFTMMFLMFYVSKEFMLLTYCLLRLVTLSEK